MFEMICLFGYTLNIVYAFETTWTQLIAFYVGSSFFGGIFPILITWLKLLKF